MHLITKTSIEQHCIKFPIVFINQLLFVFKNKLMFVFVLFIAQLIKCLILNVILDEIM